MADLAEVEEALIDLISNTLYPAGTNAPSAVGADCRIFRGWPLSTGLSTDLGSGVANVTVFPSSGTGRVLPALPITYRFSAPLPPFTVSVSGNTIAFTGTPSASYCAGALVDGSAYVYRPQAGDSAAIVAAALAASVNVDQIAQLSGALVTIPGASTIIARIVADTTSMVEVRRQEREETIACWCPTPALRDSIAATIDGALAAVSFLTLPDSSSVRLRYHDTTLYDQAQNALLYRRDLIYTMEYATVIRQSAPAMLFGDLQMGAVGLIT